MSLPTYVHPAVGTLDLRGLVVTVVAVRDEDIMKTFQNFFRVLASPAAPIAIKPYLLIRSYGGSVYPHSGY